MDLTREPTAAALVEELSCAIAGWKDAEAVKTNKITMSAASLFFM